MLFIELFESSWIQSCKIGYIILLICISVNQIVEKKLLLRVKSLMHTFQRIFKYLSKPRHWNDLILTIGIGLKGYNSTLGYILISVLIVLRFGSKSLDILVRVVFGIISFHETSFSHRVNAWKKETEILVLMLLWLQYTYR